MKAITSILLTANLFAFSARAALSPSPTELVNVFVGTAPANVKDAVSGGKGGATFPGAVVPFGMVQLGPETNAPERSGYNYLDSHIKHFSFTHMSGPGCSNMGEVPFIPYRGEDAIWPKPTDHSFSHANELAEPGYYKVKFDDATVVELTATTRTGTVRVDFPQAKVGEEVGFLFNTSFTAVSPSTGIIKYKNDRQFSGYMKGGGFCRSKSSYDVFFSFDVSQPAIRREFKNGVAKIGFRYEGKPVLLKLGLSYVSEKNAGLNLQAEQSSFDFDKTKREASLEWHNALSTIRVDGSTAEKQKIFYTSLYHSLLHPNIGSDVNGEYKGFDFKTRVNPNRPYYVNFSGWDIYRSQVQLLALLFPKRASDIANALVRAGEQCGSYPKWSLNNVETNIMIGDPGALTVANLHAFGAKDFDTGSALKLMKHSALNPNAACQGAPTRSGSADYMKYGYIPNKDTNRFSAAITLELVSADYGIAQFAKSVGDANFASQMQKRSGTWRNLWDSSTQLIRPKLTDGSWLNPFNPNSDVGFCEGNAVQYTWMIPHDVTELVKRMGGDEKTNARLDAFLSDLNAGQFSPNMYIGNEPAFGVPWIYLWTHSPHKTQEAVRRIMESQFKDEPGGLAGNDDLGALSSWYVWGALGMYPAIPGASGLVVGSPTFANIVITPEGAAKSIKITAPGADKLAYVSSLKLGEAPWTSTWIPLGELFKGGRLEFGMNAKPQMWGSSVDAKPPF